MTAPVPLFIAAAATMTLAIASIVLAATPTPEAGAGGSAQLRRGARPGRRPAFAILASSPSSSSLVLSLVYVRPTGGPRETGGRTRRSGVGAGRAAPKRLLRHWSYWQLL